MFTFTQAFARLAASQYSLILTQYGAMSAGQQLDLGNKILEEWYNNVENWRGVRKEVTGMASSSGIITLAAAYLRAEQRFIVINADGDYIGVFPIKDLDHKYQPNGTGYYDSDETCVGLAGDLGDNASGVRRYQLDGDPTVLDTYTYNAICRLRYVWATDANTTVVPDCYPAFEMSWRAQIARNEQAYDDAEALMMKAYQMLDANVGAFNQGNDRGVLPIDPMVGMGSVANLV